MDDQDVATSLPSSASANSRESTVSKTPPSPKTSETTGESKQCCLEGVSSIFTHQSHAHPQ
jgi:hypothetical protein